MFLIWQKPLDVVAPLYYNNKGISVGNPTKGGDFLEEILGNLRLFAGIDPAELSAMLACLEAKTRLYSRGEYLFRAGQSMESVALLLSGCVHIQREDYWGNLSILSEITAGDIFGESYAVPGGAPLAYDIVAVADSRVMLLNAARVITVCSNSCRFHNLLVRNLFGLLAEKNRILTQKLGHMAQRSTREKLLSYLFEQSRKAGSTSFTIAFNRQQLADFLAVDRSAMSAELSRMKRDGLLDYRRNRFTLK